MQIRKASFAGNWYPGDAAACERQIRQFIASSTQPEGLPAFFRGGIVPHAGWYFSGAIACNVIYHLSQHSTPDVIAICGMHLGPQSPCVIMTEGAWETPFGPLPVAAELAQALARQFDCACETPEDFNRDNTIELQLPFIRYFFPQASVVTIGAPPNPGALALGQALAEMARENGQRLLVIGSTDLTHYGANYGFAPKGSGEAGLDWVRRENDQRMIDAMLKLDAPGVIQEGLAHHNACCAGAVAATITAVKAAGAHEGRMLTYSTSYDKSPGDSFVGYVGIVF